MTRSPVPRPFPTVTRGTQERGVLPRSPRLYSGERGNAYHRYPHAKAAMTDRTWPPRPAD